MDPTAAPWRALDASASTGPSSAGVANESAHSSAGIAGVPWPAVGLVVLAVLVAVVAFVVAATPAGSVAVDGGAAVDPSGIADAEPSDAAEIVVEVAGAVVDPGVYRLPAGTRVGEAIEAAGGYGPRVDADRAGRELNLAALVVDGEQVRVPSRDDPAPKADPQTGTGGEDPGGGLINLNTASQTELESLPGIGPVTAGKIMESREQQPFASVDELRGRELVGEKTFEDVRDLVTVR